MKDAGFKQNALYLIRPDEHVVLTTDKQWLRVSNVHLEEFGVLSFGAD